MFKKMLAVCTLATLLTGCGTKEINKENIYNAFTERGLKVNRVIEAPSDEPLLDKIYVIEISDKYGESYKAIFAICREICKKEKSDGENIILTNSGKGTIVVIPANKQFIRTRDDITPANSDIIKVAKDIANDF